MRWIDKKDLEKWAKRLDARALMADLVADLIRATIPDASRFRFPGGDAGQLRGWDGDLETAEAVSYVPARKSKWEFGVGAGLAKATADYNKRTEKTSLQVMNENSLVLVNLECWDTPRELLTQWEDERKAEGKWVDVKYIDGIQLVHWLDMHPAVAARYARDVLSNAPQEGALSTDEYWDEYSLQFKPRLTEQLIVGDRKAVADELLVKLAGPAQSVMLGAETSEEVIAFAVAAIRSAEPQTRRALENKTLIVRTEPAARFLSQHAGLVFITTDDAEKLTGVLAQKGVTLSAAIGFQARKHPMLKPQTASSMADGFVTMGIDRDEGYELAQRCGRNLTVLKRLRPSGRAPEPEWLPQAAALKPAFMAGGWSSNVKLDCEVLRELSGAATYANFEGILFPTLALADRPIDRVSDVWQVRAPVDAFHFYGELIGDGDLARLRAAVLKVFSHIVEGPSRDQAFSLNYVAPEDYSKWLRDGLALTLLLVAALHGVGGLQMNGTTPQQYVDDIITALPEWGKNHRVLIGLGDQTAHIAEAAPSPFLTALESMLEGNPAQLSRIFAPEDTSFFGRTSPHVAVLWALEVLAWDPKHLNRSSLVLAKLAMLDPTPDSNFVNRPINSLRSILLSWAPNTYATSTQRLACLDVILAKVPEIGWQLLDKLLPKSHDTSSPTQKPRLRDVAPRALEVLTFGMVWDYQNAIVSRAVDRAIGNEERVIALVKAFGAFRPEGRAKVVELVDQHLRTHQSNSGNEVWFETKSELARHEYFDAEWAIPELERAEIRALLERHRPTDPLAADRELFDDWMPHIGRYDPDAVDLDQVNRLRAEVLNRTLTREGVAGLVRLFHAVKLPNLVGPTMHYAVLSEDRLIELLEGFTTGDVPTDLAFYASAIGAERYGEDWRRAFTSKVLPRLATEETVAQLLVGWPLDQSTWSYVQGLGDHINEQYWRQVQLLPVRGTTEELIFAVERLQHHGRSIEAIGLLHLRVKDLPSPLLVSLLEQAILQVNEGVKRMGTMLPYYIGRALEVLRKRGDVPELQIAKIEYAYLPVLSNEREPLTIVDLLSKDAELFVDVLSHVFRGRSAPADEDPSTEARAKARVSYQLLSAMKTVPGQSGAKIDSKVLTEWVHLARQTAKGKDLAEIADQYIGHVFAHAVQDAAEDFWPPAPVCTVIESVASVELEKGFRIECFNKRGVHGKAMHEGGIQERALAAQYQAWAEKTPQFPRTSALLNDIAEMWFRDADNEDVRSEKEMLKY